MRALLGGGEVDCRAPGACVLIAALYDETAGDYVEAARAPLGFDPDGPLAPPPTLTVSPGDGAGRRPVGDGVGCRRARGLRRARAVRGGAERMGGLRPGHATSSWRHPAAPSSRRGGCSPSSARGPAPWTAGRPAAACLAATVTGSFTSGETATVPLVFDPAAPLLPPPTLTVSPSTDLVDGETVSVEGSGFVRVPEFWPVQLYQCAPGPAPDRCRQAGEQVYVDGEGGFALDVAVTARVPVPGGQHDCRTGADPCVLVATSLGAGLAARRRRRAGLRSRRRAAPRPRHRRGSPRQPGRLHRRDRDRHGVHPWRPGDRRGLPGGGELRDRAMSRTASRRRPTPPVPSRRRSACSP